MSITKSIKNSLLTAGGLVSFSNNAPVQFGDRQQQFFSPETKTFTQVYARYASDFMEARVQGLDPENPFAWQTRRLRLADIVRPSAAIQRRFDNFKMVLFEDRDIEYITPGAKIETMGSTWLVVNPLNVSGSDGSGIVERCNATWNYFDYYGNLCKEPIVITNRRADANAPDPQESNLVTKGYFQVECQYNDFTAQINTNTRVILGSGGYQVTGYSDFLQEFTGDYDTVRILEFTLRFEEPNREIDDLVNHVAGGKNFSWDIDISGAESIGVGSTVPFSASSIRMGETVESTEENPISYAWSSSNENAATVDADGNVTGVGEGTAVITAALAQNTDITESVTVEITAGGQDGVRFTSPIPDSLAAFDDAVIEAAFFEGGVQTGEPIAWNLSGASQDAYKTIIGGNTVTIYCFKYSPSPLIVEAESGGYKASAVIRLEGI